MLVLYDQTLSHKDHLLIILLVDSVLRLTLPMWIPMYHSDIISIPNVCISICIDIDECQLLNGGCEQNCTNLDGSYECSCYDGFTLDAATNSCTGTDAYSNTVTLGSSILFFFYQ